MSECINNQHESWVELSSQELEQVQGGNGLVIESVETGSDPYQGKRSSGGYVPT